MDACCLRSVPWHYTIRNLCKQSLPYTPAPDVYVNSESATVRIMRKPPAKLMKWSMELRTFPESSSGLFIPEEDTIPVYSKSPACAGLLLRLLLGIRN